MFKMKGGQFINPKLVSSVTLKEVGKPPRYYFAVNLCGNHYIPSEWFDDIKDAKAWFATLREAVDA